VDGSEKYRTSSPTKDLSFFAAKPEMGTRRRRARNNQRHFKTVLPLMLASFLEFIKTS
jgi:hypothetical protein